MRIVSRSLLLLALILMATTGRTQKSPRAPDAPKPAELSSEGQRWVAQTLKSMSLDEKIGQLFAVWAYGSFLPSESQDYKDLLRDVETATRKTSHGNPRLDARAPCCLSAVQSAKCAATSARPELSPSKLSSAWRRSSWMRERTLRRLSRSSSGGLPRMTATSIANALVELAMSWLACQPVVSSVISGATRPEQVTENVKACGWKLTHEEMKEVDAITRH